MSLRGRINKFGLTRVKNHSGLTLVEIMIAVLILSFVLVGLLETYIVCLDLVEISKNASIAVNLAQTKLEAIKDSVVDQTTYYQVKTNYDNVPFDIAGLTGKGISYAFYCNNPADCDPSYAPTDLLEVIVSISWKQKSRRVIGEDKNINGILDIGEDISPANNILDSPVQIVTFVADIAEP